MLRKFKVRVDGEEYLVEMEEIGGSPAPTPQIRQEAAVTQPIATKIKEPTTATPANTEELGEGVLDSPMPGTILKILVKPGEFVPENQPLLILEAMKMENEIVCKKSGVVKEIFVTQGQVVNAGDTLIAVE